MYDDDLRQHESREAHPQPLPRQTPGGGMGQAADAVRRAVEVKKRLEQVRRLKATLTAVKAVIAFLAANWLFLLIGVAIAVVAGTILYAFSFFTDRSADEADRQAQLQEALEAARTPGELCAVLSRHGIDDDPSSPAAIMKVYCETWDRTKPLVDATGLILPSAWNGPPEEKLALFRTDDRPVYADLEAMIRRESVSIFEARSFDLFDLYAVHFEFWHTCRDPATGEVIERCGLMYFDADRDYDPDDPESEQRWRERMDLIRQRVEEDMLYIAQLLNARRTIEKTFYLRKSCEVMTDVVVDPESVEPPAAGCPGSESPENDERGVSDAVREAEAEYRACLVEAELAGEDPSRCTPPSTRVVDYMVLDPVHTTMEDYLYPKEEVIRIYAREKGQVTEPQTAANTPIPGGFQPASGPFAREIIAAVERTGFVLSGSAVTAEDLLTALVRELAGNDPQAGAAAGGFTCQAAGFSGADCWDELAARDGVPGPAVPADNPYSGVLVPARRLGLAQLTAAESLAGLRVCGTGDFFRQGWDQPEVALCTAAARLKQIWRSPEIPARSDASLYLLAYLDGEGSLQQVLSHYPGVKTAAELKEAMRADPALAAYHRATATDADAVCAPDDDPASRRVGGKVRLLSCRAWDLVERVLGSEAGSAAGVGGGADTGSGSDPGAADGSGAAEPAVFVGVSTAPEYERYLNARNLILGVWGMEESAPPRVMYGSQISAQFAVLPDLGRPIILAEDDLFGWRMHPILNVWHQHYGVDFPVPMGTDVLAIGDPGTEIRITQVGQDAKCGGLVRYSTVVDHQPITVRYCHLSVFRVSEGEIVQPGQVVALSGGAPGHPLAGSSTGAHLHVEVYRGGVITDPLPWIIRR